MGGRQYAKLLRRHGVNSAFAFTQKKDAWVKKHMAVVGLRLVKELRGESCLDLEEMTPPKKGICTSRGFGERLTDYSLIEEATANYAVKCARKLRKQKSCARVMTVFIETNHFSERDLQYSNSRTITLPVASNSDLELIQYASLALKYIFRPGYKYKKTGVFLTEVVPDNQIQFDLLDSVDRVKHSSIMQTIDRLTSRYGRDTVKVASQGYDNSWQLKCERRSPFYTTRLSDIAVVHNRS
jgi:DNA polymerase V